MVKNNSKRQLDTETALSAVLPVNTSVSANGSLVIGGCDTAELAARFGTPLQVFDEDNLRQNCRQYRKALASYPGSVEITYASKALAVKEIYRILQQEGIGIDVVSGGELYTVKEAGVAAAHIHMHGNNKSESEINQALDYEISLFIVDNMQEAVTINRLAEKTARRQDILLRVAPGITGDTHHFNQTGQFDSKFGVHLQHVPAFAERLLDLPQLKLRGLHAHIGSNIFQIDSFCANAGILINLMADLRQSAGLDMDTLNLGGGLAIAYTPQQAEILPTPAVFAERIINEIKIVCRRRRLKLPTLMLEPGRSIVGRPGVTLYTVGSIKQYPGQKKYVAVDGGMADNPRPALYQAVYHPIAAQNPLAAAEEKVTIAGKFCESGDILVDEAMLPPLNTGDLLLLPATGAYCYALSSNYNMAPRPAVVMVKEGKARLVVRRESFADMLKNQI